MANPADVAINNLCAANPDRDLIVISREITRRLHYDLTASIRANRKHDKCTVFLTTNGGDPDGGYRIARCLRHNYKHVRLVIPSLCKSAGTLIAIGANEIIVGDLGELGPLDIQVRNSQELAERSSGLDIIQALSASLEHAQEAFRKSLVELRSGARLSTKLAGEFASKLAIGVCAQLYGQIDPSKIGEMQRAMRIAHEYGARLNKYTNALRDGALETLVTSYPSHAFVIDRKEAGELFTSVAAPTDTEEEFCRKLWNIFAYEVNIGPEYIRPVANDGVENGQTDADSVEEQAAAEPAALPPGGAPEAA